MIHSQSFSLSYLCYQSVDLTTSHQTYPLMKLQQYFHIGNFSYHYSLYPILFHLLQFIFLQLPLSQKHTPVLSSLSDDCLGMYSDLRSPQTAVDSCFISQTNYNYCLSVKFFKIDIRPIDFELVCEFSLSMLQVMLLQLLKRSPLYD